MTEDQKWYDDRSKHFIPVASDADANEQAKRDIEIKKRLYEDAHKLRVALTTARLQLITLGGNYETGDAIHAAVLGEIDAALCMPRTDQGA
jgi:hypothetical protein